MFTFMLTLAAIGIIGTVGCIVADHIFPHIKPLDKFMDSLPMFWGK